MAIGVNGSPYTVDDLEGTPDDGHRYELIDGMLLVSPTPAPRHQKISMKLGSRLDAECPEDLHVFAAPFAVRQSNNTELQPDLLVCRDSDLTHKLLHAPPLLAVEILSPSSVLNDFNTKKAVYERMGVPSYWVIDPEVPTLTVFEFGADGLYEQTAVVKAEKVFEATAPFPVRFSPAELLGTLK
ncbi:Uma2 family endonuclease [Lentzea sp. NPDC051838]|uniref:Uma2 family endonuclease n=1 Tax=Lentzea sp. NPDC051838 TaxID=3154849 RepID=UPI00342D9960